jgi:prepilin signal peptidase PulO-like enzyme (type II secretory pathway)
MDPLLVAGCAAGGFLVGDFLEPLGDRLPKKLSLERPWWRCPECESPDTGIGLVPIARTIFRLRGCNNCEGTQRHPWRPLVQGALTGAVLAGMAVRFGADVVLAAYCVVGIALVAISIIDFQHKIVPNRILYPAVFTATPLLVIGAAIDHRWTSLWHAAVCAAIGFAALFTVHFI